jgi:hypothetical protein
MSDVVGLLRPVDSVGCEVSATVVEEAWGAGLNSDDSAPAVEESCRAGFGSDVSAVDESCRSGSGSDDAVPSSRHSVYSNGGDLGGGTEAADDASP